MTHTAASQRFWFSVFICAQWLNMVEHLKMTEDEEKSE